MGLTTIKQDFKFQGNNIDEVQQKYDNLIQDSSNTFLKQEHYLSGLQEYFLATDRRTQQLNEHQHEVIKEQQESLHIFKKKTTDSMESTCLLLNRHHTKQPQINLDEAKNIKDILEAEQLNIKKKLCSYQGRCISNHY